MLNVTFQYSIHFYASLFSIHLLFDYFVVVTDVKLTISLLLYLSQ
jgi:hypothetical protein